MTRRETNQITLKTFAIMCLTWAQIKERHLKVMRCTGIKLIDRFFELLAAGCWGLALSAVVVGCGKPLPALENVNLQDWKNDKNGCNGLRLAMKESVTSQKDKLLSLTETDMLNLLGKSDETELYKRSEKFYKYYFNGGPDCAKDSIQASVMIIRFNAMNLAKEVMVE
jgi:hypothetical protein